MVKQAFLIPRRSVLLWPQRFSMAVANVLSVLFLVWQGPLVGDFLRGGTEGGDSTPPWDVQCLSAMVPWHLDLHASATSPSLLRDDQNLRNKCVAVLWQRAKHRASPHPHLDVTRMSSPGLRSPPLTNALRWAQTRVLKTETRVSKRAF